MSSQLTTVSQLSSPKTPTTSPLNIPPTDVVQLDWGLVWPVQAGRPEPRWRRRGGMAEWQRLIARRVSQGRGESRFSFPSTFLLIHLSSGSPPVPSLHSNHLFVFPIHCYWVEAKLRSRSGMRHAVAETEMTGETRGIVDELMQWQGVGWIY